jgi:hypothetical protein
MLMKIWTNVGIKLGARCENVKNSIPRTGSSTVSSVDNNKVPIRKGTAALIYHSTDAAPQETGVSRHRSLSVSRRHFIAVSRIEEIGEPDATLEPAHQKEC